MMKNSEQFILEPHEYSMYLYREPDSEGLVVLYTVYNQEQCIVEHIPKKNVKVLYDGLQDIAQPCILVEHSGVLIRFNLNKQTIDTMLDIIRNYYNMT